MSNLSVFSFEKSPVRTILVSGARGFRLPMSARFFNSRISVLLLRFWMMTKRV